MRRSPESQPALFAEMDESLQEVREEVREEVRQEEASPAPEQQAREWLTPAHRRHSLWLCLYLSRLPLEVLSRGPSSAPRIVFQEEGRSDCLVAVDERAVAMGLHPGMPVNGAFALAPDLEAQCRDIAREQAALVSLADWAGQFSPVVSIEPDDALLLEIRGSLKLFGGLEKLRARLTAGLLARGHEVITACAPTARAALWLTRAGIPAVIHDGADLPSRLAMVPIEASGWPERTRKLLRQMGIRTMGECLRLPRQGFARRVGVAGLRELEQGFGRTPEVRPVHQSPVRLREALELPVETSDLGLILEACRMLLDRLVVDLESRQAGIRMFWCRLYGVDSRESRLCIRLHRASADPALLLSLLRLRLEAEPPVFAVSALALQADPETRTTLSGADLLGSEMTAGEGMSLLVDRLRERFGEGSVHGLALAPEHRPERAWKSVTDPLQSRRSVPGSDAACLQAKRPVWLLPIPRKIGRQAKQLAWQGPIVLESGPERIETGWWDGGDIRRDYYVARNGHGMRLWVFEDLRARSWYVHGVFG